MLDVGAVCTRAPVRGLSGTCPLVYNAAMLLRTLGGLELPASSLTRPKPLLLLAYLALEGPQERRHLSELFWPGATDPLNRLAVTLARLRGAGPTVVGADHLRVWTDLAADAQVLLDALEGGKCEEADGLYRGPFLAGFYLRDVGAELEEWVYATRERIASRVRSGQLRVAESFAVQGHFPEAARLAERAYRLPGAADPEPEELGRLYALMLAGGSVQAAEVRREAEAFGVRLSLTPEEARRRLGGRERVPPHNLTPQPTPLVGREAELVALARKLHDPGCRLLTVVGPGGVGKTRLALEAARVQLSIFKDGVYFVSFVPVGSPTEMVYAVSDALGLKLLGPDEPLAQLADHLETKTVLLVLDNLEHLLTDVSLVEALLRRTPQVKLLATSRERLNLRAEHVFDLQGLEVPPPAEPERPGVADFETFAAVKLFLQCARRLQPDFAVDRLNAEAVRRVCALVGGLPLALEVAAGWLRVLGPAEIAQEIERGIDLLEATTRDLPERHRSVRAVFDQSWALLTETEQAVLKRLSVFRGGFNREAALEVTGASLPVLAGLVDKSLLRAVPGGRYRRHLLVIQYTQERLANDLGEKARAEEAHGLYYLHLFGGRVQKLKSLERKRTLAALRADLPNFNAAWRWAVKHGRGEEIRRGVRAIGEVHRHQEAVELLHAAAKHLSGADPGQPTDLSYVLIELGFKQAYLGLQEQAVLAAERGLALVRASGDAEGVLDGLHALSSCKFFVGDFRRCKRLAKAGLARARRLGHAGYTSIFLAQLAGVTKEFDDLPDLEGFYEEGLAEVRQLHGYPEYHAAYLQHYATYLVHSGDPARAQALARESQNLFERLGHERWLSGCLHIRGVAALKLGDLDEAEGLLREALAGEERLGKKFMQAAVLSNVASVATVRGDYAAAEGYLQRSLQLGLDIENPFNLAAALVSLAELRLAQGQPLEAAAYLALVACQPTAEKPDRDEARWALAGLRDQVPPEVLEAAIKRIDGLTLPGLAGALLRAYSLRQD